MMDQRDLALQRICPVVAVPHFSKLPPPDRNGERVLLASNGTFLEVKRQWGYFIRKIGNIEGVLPFGSIEQITRLNLPKMPKLLLDEFNSISIQNKDKEVAACIIWNELDNSFRLIKCTALSSSNSHIKYKVPPLLEGDHLIIDCHSHSHHKAFFSSTDNDDDKDSVKFSFVVGNCGSSKQSYSMRLCIRGIYQNIDMDRFWQK